MKLAIAIVFSCALALSWVRASHVRIADLPLDCPCTQP